jgi:hypothetical protein
LGYADILGLIDDREIEWRPVVGTDLGSETAEEIGVGDKLCVVESLPDAIEDRPQ